MKKCLYRLIAILSLCSITTACSTMQKEEALEVAVDVAEEALDEAVEHYIGVDPEFDFNGNDTKKEEK